MISLKIYAAFNVIKKSQFVECFGTLKVNVKISMQSQCQTEMPMCHDDLLTYDFDKEYNSILQAMLFPACALSICRFSFLYCVTI